MPVPLKIVSSTSPPYLTKYLLYKIKCYFSASCPKFQRNFPFHEKGAAASRFLNRKAAAPFSSLMQLAGLEPARALCSHEPESCAYANSATTAHRCTFNSCFLCNVDYITILPKSCQYFFKIFTDIFHTAASMKRHMPVPQTSAALHCYN